MNSPPTLAAGKHNSLKTDRRATARAVTISNFSRYGLFLALKVSARSWINVTSVKPSLATKASRKAIRLFNESTIVTFNCGKAIFNGKEGKPAPAPISHNVSSSLSKRGSANAPVIES